MVFVLLTFGGWNEAAYISAEMRKGRRQIVYALILGIFIITAIYVLINLAYMNVLGLGGVAGSNAVAGDMMRAVFGEGGVWFIGLLVALAALTSANATIFTGARTNYALGRDHQSFRLLGQWNERSQSPVNAFVIQGAIALALVGMSIWTRDGIQAIIDYSAPVFWFFLLMTGLSLIVLRYREPDAERVFRVPLYPVTPIIFCLTSSYLLYSSIAYTGRGAFVGVAVLVLGGIVLAALSFISRGTDTNSLRRNNDEITPA